MDGSATSSCHPGLYAVRIANQPTEHANAGADDSQNSRGLRRISRRQRNREAENARRSERRGIGRPRVANTPTQQTQAELAQAQATFMRLMYDLDRRRAHEEAQMIRRDAQEAEWEARERFTTPQYEDPNDIYNMQHRSERDLRRLTRKKRKRCIRNLPLHTISREDLDEDGEFICPIDFVPFEEGEQAKTLPDCKDFFGKDGIDHWLMGGSNICQMCRTVIQDLDSVEQKVHVLPGWHVVVTGD